MKIIYVQSYPVYHDLLSVDEWIALENRDKWMPAITAELGHEVEIWATSTHHQMALYTWKEGVEITIRLFKADHSPSKSKYHFSSDMLAYARQHPADYYVIKGLDGGTGVRLVELVLKPQRRLFAYVVGGKCTSPHLHLAHAVFYESDVQVKLLTAPYWTATGRKKTKAHLIKLPKSVDTDHFKPLPEVDKSHDLISAGRLIPYYKNFDDLFTLAPEFTVAFIGGGPLLTQNQTKWPSVHWWGPVSNAQVVNHLNTAKAFFYPSKRDYFPRALVEASAVGLPVLCFDHSIGPDVVPDSIGLRLNGSTFRESIRALFREPSRLTEMGVKSREHALAHYGKESTKEAIRALLELLK